MLCSCPVGNYDANKGLPYQLFSTFSPIPGSFQVAISVLSWQTPIILIEMRVNTRVSPTIVCLLKDQVNIIIKLFFEIGTIIDP